jgi:RNA polymerase sigma factor (TIGR02999 family)
MDQSLVRHLVQRDRNGDPAALEELLPLVYDQLRRMAARYLRDERPGHTLAPTALVHEAYLRLAGADLELQDRAHFLALASGVMRRVLMDHARTRNRQKRGAGAHLLSLDEIREIPSDNIAELLGLDLALEELAKFDARKARIVELTYFGGLTYDEVAGVLNISSVTVHRDLRLAKAWLERELAAPQRS